jgi:hypothetical protein
MRHPKIGVNGASPAHLWRIFGASHEMRASQVAQRFSRAHLGRIS